MSRPRVNVVAEIHGSSEPAAWSVGLEHVVTAGLGFRKGDAASQTTWRFEP